MGTNYYVNQKPCASCGRGSEQIHVGKSSGGWKFLFQRHDILGLNSKVAWEKYLKEHDGSIVDEYYQKISARALIAKIELTQDEKGKTSSFGEALDAQGYRISNGREFF